MTAIYTDERCLNHYAPNHPESPERVRVALEALRAAGSHRWPAVVPAHPSLLAAVHGQQHVRTVAHIADAGGGWADPDTFVGPASYTAALCAAGATLQATADVLAGNEPNTFVVARPPGHHATVGRPMGFCLFNNVAAAAHWAISEGRANRVAIVDIDVHHGNGTQDIFYDRADVLYYSTHQYPFYPGTGRLTDIGHGDGMGTTINVPLMAGCADHAFLSVTDQILVPSLRRFSPELVLVSLGFDAHWADPLAHMHLSLDGYLHILSRVLAIASELCGGRVVLALEGGYDLQVIAEGARMVGQLLSGQPTGPDPMGPTRLAAEAPAVGQLLEKLRETHDLPTG